MLNGAPDGVKWKSYLVSGLVESRPVAMSTLYSEGSQSTSTPRRTSSPCSFLVSYGRIAVIADVVMKDASFHPSVPIR